MRIRLRGAVFILLLISVVLVALPPGSMAQVGVNLYGSSKHLNTRADTDLRPFNPGVGLNWTLERWSRAALELSAGVYRDSFGETNRHWALGARVRVLGPFELGGQLVRAQSASVLDDMIHMGLLPMVTVRGRRAAVSAIYIPTVDGVNGIRTVGFIATVYPFGEGWIWERPGGRARQGSRALEFNIGRNLGLEARGGLGVAWRRMFNPRHGLRLGADLSGAFESRTQDGSLDVDITDYSAALSIQYLRRHPGRGRLVPYWAAGVKTEFRSVSENGVFDESTAAESIIVDLGVEYELGRGWGILAEYATALRFDSQRRADPWNELRDRSTGLQHGVRLGLVAAYGTRATDERKQQ